MCGINIYKVWDNSLLLSVFRRYSNGLQPLRRQTLTSRGRLLIWQEMPLNVLCNHMKRAAGQGANYINFERVSVCVIAFVCLWEGVRAAAIITKWLHLLYSIFDEVNLIFRLDWPHSGKLKITTVGKNCLWVFVWEDLSVLRRLSHLLGGVQPNQHQSHSLPAECYLGVQGHRAHRAYHLHHWSGRDDL